ncbi:uncharacterized protein LOC123502647 [Portunus trituberculatus]|uniref:uncharacterized protein LOC123502647 n=1 Tax=Portunus trituberculatus TaxID=210409 RepID=UPI001E1CD7B2|nr:uncharacterized protein LOC123502647 [Portunus trituberculatus]
MRRHMTSAVVAPTSNPPYRLPDSVPCLALLRDPQPYCEDCLVPFTVRHLLALVSDNGNNIERFVSTKECYHIERHHFHPDHDRLGLQLIVTAARYRMSTTIVTPLMHWSAFCIAIAPGEPATIYFNGEKAKNATNTFGNDKDKTRASRNTVLMDTDGTIVLGQDQDAPADVYDAAESLSGSVTDMNVWSRRLRGDEMAAISGCLTRGKGDVLDWDNSEFEIGLDCSIVCAHAPLSLD